MTTDRYNTEIESAAARYGVPPEWLWAIIGAESSFRDIYRTWEPKVHEYAYGPMQVLQSTASDFGFTEEQLQTVQGGIDAGAALVADLMRRVGSDFNRMYSAYNSGDPEKWTISDQVKTNVLRAADWLARFAGIDSGAPGAPAAAAVPGWLWLLVIGGFFWWHQQKAAA